MSEQTKIYGKLWSSALAVLAGCAIVIGCGGGNASPGSASRSTTVPRTANPNSEPDAAQHAATTKRDTEACEQAVRSAPSLTAAAKTEIKGLCFRINYVPEDNEKTVRAVCQEVASASASSSETARKRTVAACYAVGIG